MITQGHKQCESGQKSNQGQMTKHPQISICFSFILYNLPTITGKKEHSQLLVLEYFQELLTTTQLEFLSLGTRLPLYLTSLQTLPQQFNLTRLECGSSTARPHPNQTGLQATTGTPHPALPSPTCSFSGRTSLSHWIPP